MDGKRILQTAGLWFRRGSYARGQYLRKKKIFGMVGEQVRYQPRIIPLYPELIRLHNNIMVASGVRFVTHDASFVVLNHAGRGQKYPEKAGCIEVMDNVFIGYNATILPNVRIGENVIIGAGSVVTKDLEANGVYAGSPARKIGTFEEYARKCEALPDGGYDYPTVKRNQKITEEEIQKAWAFFEKKREAE